MSTVRRERINGEIRKIISDIISNELKDPAVPPLTSVTGVEITADMSYAKVNVSVLGSAEQLAAAVEALKRASGFVRRELGHRMTIRHVPQLVFQADHSIERSIALQQTIHAMRHHGRVAANIGGYNRLAGSHSLQQNNPQAFASGRWSAEGEGRPGVALGGSVLGERGSDRGRE